jgi:hypothetical protein
METQIRILTKEINTLEARTTFHTNWPTKFTFHNARNLYHKMIINVLTLTTHFNPWTCRRVKYNQQVVSGPLA